MKRIITIDKCADCNIETCNIRTMCGTIPENCPLQKESEAQKTTSWDDAVKELQECRSYVMSYEKTLSEEMGMHVADKFPDGYMAKLLQSELEEGMKAILKYRKERLNETNTYN